MNEEEAHAVVRLRALEEARAGSSATGTWSEADSAWADREARRAEGERATFERWVVARARAADDRLATRRSARTGAGRAVREGLRGAARAAPVGWAIVLIAFLAGVASDVVGGTSRINLLAPPLLAIVAWNLAVYIVLIASAAGLRLGGSEGALAGPRRWLQALAGTGFEWARAAAPLHAARFGAVLHAAAFALAAGALLSLYVRGIAFEFRAGWDSTFLTAGTVHAIVAAVLGPAAKLAGIGLPDAAQLDALRFSRGAGENAARWIHLHAITVALAVLLPRSVLALASAWRARRLARDVPLALNDLYFQRLRRRWSPQPVAVHVLPYSYTPGPRRRDALRPVLERIVGPGAMPHVHEPVPVGAEDDVDDLWQTTAPNDEAASGSVDNAVRCVLFAMTATPEREQHGAFAAGLAARASRPEQVIVLVDESGFRERFSGDDYRRRRHERRSAWEAMLRDEHLQPVFVNLDDPDGALVGRIADDAAA